MNQLAIPDDAVIGAISKINCLKNSEVMRSLEAIGDLIDPRTPFIDEPGFGWLSRGFGYVTTVRDRAEGRFIPIYDNELDLRAIRMACRLIGQDIPVAEAMRRRLCEYTISSGFDWDVKHENPEIQSYLKHAIDETLENSGWMDLEIETFNREFEDGEAIGRIVQSSGDFSIEMLEPEYLTEPARPGVLDDHYGFYTPTTWSFGVATASGRTDRPLAYHICRDGVGTDWDVFLPKDVFHWRRNVTANAKRGVSDGYLTLKWLKHASKLASNTAIGAAIQAAIAYIVEHAPTTTAPQAQAIAENRFNSNVVVKYDYTSGSQYNRKEVRAGSVVDIKAGAKYHAALLGSNASNIYVEVMEALFRLSGTVYAMPESMMTGYAGNNNRASSETAESPFIQGRKMDQRKRVNQLKKLLKLICEVIARRTGWEWDRVRAGLKLIVQPPDIVNRNVQELTTALVQQKQMGWVSNQLAMQQLGYDPSDVEAQLEKEEKEAAEKQAKTPRAGFQGQPASQDQGQSDQIPPGQSQQVQESFDPTKHPRAKDGKFSSKPKISKPKADSAIPSKLLEVAKSFEHKGAFGKSEWMKRKSGLSLDQAIDAVDSRAMAFAMHLQEAGLVKAGKVSLNVSKADKLHKPGIESARRWLSAMGATNFVEATVVKATTRRDSYENDKIYVAGLQAFPSAIVHEYGHHLEMNSPKMKSASARFIEDRIDERNLERVKMSEIKYGYSDLEVGARGFSNAFESEARGAYASVRYQKGGSEAVAMGLQALYDNPVKFIKSDPEYAAFILEQLQ